VKTSRRGRLRVGFSAWLPVSSNSLRGRAPGVKPQGSSPRGQAPGVKPQGSGLRNCNTIEGAQRKPVRPLQSLAY
jgi:hypothetical protein